MAGQVPGVQRSAPSMGKRKNRDHNIGGPTVFDILPCTTPVSFGTSEKKIWSFNLIRAVSVDSVEASSLSPQDCNTDSKDPFEGACESPIGRPMKRRRVRFHLEHCELSPVDENEGASSSAPKTERWYTRDELKSLRIQAKRQCSSVQSLDVLNFAYSALELGVDKEQMVRDLQLNA
jgi:hypothetical protein